MIPRRIVGMVMVGGWHAHILYIMNFRSEIRLCKKVNPQSGLLPNFYAPNGQSSETGNVNVHCVLGPQKLESMLTVEGYKDHTDGGITYLTCV